MAETAIRRRMPVIGFRHAPWSPRAWRDTVFVTAGIPVQLAAPAITVWCWLNASRHHGPSVVLPVLPAVVLIAGWDQLNRAQRHRCWSVLGMDIPAAPVIGRRYTLTGFTAWVNSGTTWRQAAYHLVAGPLLACAAVATLWAWAAGAVLAAIPAYHKALRGLPAGTGAPVPASKTVELILTAAGLALLLAAPWMAAAVRRIDTRAAAALLGPSRAEELERRVESLAETRAGVVDAADAERRRLERDLHDGAQRRLVSLALNLGMARANLTNLPDEAREVIVSAHEEAKEALTELRNLVRGLHPAILEDRGLDAALSGVVARAPLPVRLHVAVDRRPSPTVEAVAYFVVSEALTNIVKHAQASSAEIIAVRDGGVLRIAVTDDGVGGADPARGTGLAGLARRAGSVDGTFRVDSPAGGPTRITVELPCGS